MQLSSAIVLLACSLPSAAADFATYIGDVYPYNIAAIAADASGNTYLTGSRTITVSGNPQGSDVFVSKVDPSGVVTLIATFSGQGSDQANGIAVDPSGNIYIVGSSTSPDFPLRNPVQNGRYPSGPHAGFGNGFLVKMKPDGTVLYSTFLGGTTGASSMTAVAADAQGNAYVTGYTFATDSGCTQGLPCSTVAFLTNTLSPSVSGAFIAKISPTGDRILYAGRIAVPGQPCQGGFCPTTATVGASIAIDPAGNAYLAGNTYGTGLPTTPGVLQPKGVGAFVGKVNAAGAGLVFLTLLGTASETPEGDLAGFEAGTLAYSIAADAAGNAYISGSTWDPNFPATPSAFQPASPIPPATNPPEPRRTSGFVAKLNPAGSAMVWASFLGGSTGSDQARTVALDSADDVWVSGTTQSADFPASSGFPGGSEFLTEFSWSGSSLLYAARFPGASVAAALVIDRSAVVHYAGSTGTIATLTPGQASSARIYGMANAAGGVLAGRIAPGEVISIYGMHLGPSVPATASFDSNGFLPTTLAGVRLTINGTPAPLLYVSDTQINAVTPLEIVKLVNSAAALQLSNNLSALSGFRVAIDPAIPEVFRLSDGMYAAVLNQDGTINSITNPAKIGSIVSVWATGTGWTPYGEDGLMAHASSGLPCAIYDGYGVISPQYAGAAPGLVIGIVQINFQVTNSSSFSLVVDGVYSDRFSIFLTR